MRIFHKYDRLFEMFFLFLFLFLYVLYYLYDYVYFIHKPLSNLCIITKPCLKINFIKQQQKISPWKRVYLLSVYPENKQFSLHILARLGFAVVVKTQ